MDSSSIIYGNDIDTEENFNDIEESFNADIEENYNAEENANIDENYNAENADVEEPNHKEGSVNKREEPNAKESKSEETIYTECENYLKKRGYPAGASKLWESSDKEESKNFLNSGRNSQL